MPVDWRHPEATTHESDTDREHDSVGAKSRGFYAKTPGCRVNRCCTLFAMSMELLRGLLYLAEWHQHI